MRQRDAKSGKAVLTYRLSSCIGTKKDELPTAREHIAFGPLVRVLVVKHGGDPTDGAEAACFAAHDVMLDFVGQCLFHVSCSLIR